MKEHLRGERNKFNNSGSTLVGVLIAAGIVSILIYILASMSHAQQREIRRLFQKLALIDTSNIIRSLLSDASICTYNLSLPGPFDGTSVPTSGVALNSKLVVLPLIRNGTDTMASVVVENNLEIVSADGVLAKEIYVSNWLHDGAGKYSADLFIVVESASGPIAPLKIAGINIETIGAINTRTITSCKIGPENPTGNSIIAFSGDADSVTAVDVSKSFFLPNGMWTIVVSTGIEHAWFVTPINLSIDGSIVYTFPGGGADPPGTNWIPLSGTKAGVSGDRNIIVHVDEPPIAGWGGKANFTILAIKE